MNLNIWSYIEVREEIVDTMIHNHVALSKGDFWK